MGVAAAGWQAPALAHSFGQVYTLPVPFWLYAWAASATLIVSFAVAALFARATPTADAGRERPWRAVPAWLLSGLRAGAVGALLLSIATGFAGTASTYANFNMTCFWIGFVLAFAYVTALCGDLYALINPWRTLARALGIARERFILPEAAGYGIAIVLYAAFIVLELFGRTTPYSLSVALVAYTALNLVAVALIGEDAWFRRGEIFAVLLRQLARIAPVEWRARDRAGAEFRTRRALSGLLGGEPEHPTLLLFILLVLSATAFDGLHEARPWVRLFWNRIYPGWLEPAGYSLFGNAAELMRVYLDWQIASLLLSPFVYLGAYLASIALMRELTARRLGLRELALRFAPSLLPIVLAYHVTHYYTLLLTQGPRIVPILSDPFGYGWNLFDTAQWVRSTWVPDLQRVWHVQVALILAGHVASVAVAHQEALRLFPERTRATLSQLPMLALMVAFTVAGLWILSLPFDPGPVRYGG